MSPTLEQQKVIEWTGRRLAVAAGPGSGKTATLVAKLKSMTQEQRDVTAVITFTVAAAGELRTRLEETRVGFVGTLHSWCRRFLENHGSVIGMPSPFSVASAYDAEEMLEKVMADLSNPPSKKSILAKIDWVSFVTGKGDTSDPEGRCSLMYMMRLWETSRIDYDALLQLTRHLLEDRGEKSFHKILFVDEVQDSSEMDWQIYGAWNPETMIAIGDTDQSIYGWRGANPEVFLHWTHEAGVDLLTLQENFRSDRSICAAANGLISKSINRVAKETKPVSKNKGRLELRAFDDLDMAKDAIVKWVQDRDRPEEREHTWAILCRTNREVQTIRGLLEAEGCPSDDSKPLGPVNRFGLLLDVIANPNSDIAAFKALTLLCPDVKPLAARRLAMEARATNIPLSSKLAEHIPELVYAPFLRETPMDIATWKPVIDSNRYPEIRNLAAVIASLDPGADIDELATAFSEFDSDEKSKSRTVRTIHKAKGLEWGNVLIPSINEGVFPPASGNVEESRRLLFVGITRARHRFTGFYSEQSASRFLVDLGLS